MMQPRLRLAWTAQMRCYPPWLERRAAGLPNRRPLTPPSNASQVSCWQLGMLDLQGHWLQAAHDVGSARLMVEAKYVMLSLAQLL